MQKKAEFRNSNRKMICGIRWMIRRKLMAKTEHVHMKNDETYYSRIGEAEAV